MEVTFSVADQDSFYEYNYIYYSKDLDELIVMHNAFLERNKCYDCDGKDGCDEYEGMSSCYELPPRWVEKELSLNEDLVFIGVL